MTETSPNEPLIELQTTVAKQEQRLDSIATNMAALARSVERLSSDFRATQRTNWGTLIAAAALVVTIVGGIGWGFIRDLSRMESTAVKHYEQLAHPGQVASFEAFKELQEFRWTVAQQDIMQMDDKLQKEDEIVKERTQAAEDRVIERIKALEREVYNNTNRINGP